MTKYGCMVKTTKLGSTISKESFQIERWPKGIAVTSSGELVYTDDTLKIMNKTYLNSDVGLKLADCIHCSVCNTLYGDLLVVNQKLCVMIMGY